MPKKEILLERKLSVIYILSYNVWWYKALALCRFILKKNKKNPNLLNKIEY
jgi:hypothetical protein